MGLRRKVPIAAVVIAVGLVLIALGMTLFVEETTGQGHGQMSDGTIQVTALGWIIAVLGALLIVLSLIYLVVPSKARDEKSVARFYPDLAIISLKDEDALKTDTPQVAGIDTSGEPSPSLEQMALRLLEGDERRVYRKIVEADGEILQKDIVSSVPFSKAKVSRIIDKLEEKGLITKQRHGYTNKIVLVKPQ